MIRTTLILTALVSLAACGGRGSAYSSARAVPNYAPPAPVIAGAPTQTGAAAVPAPLPFARGSIFSVCISDGRKAASQKRCGCVQAVADKTLSDADERRGVSLWNDPGRLQEIRQSDNPGNERFWKAWSGFGDEATRVCSAS